MRGKLSRYGVRLNAKQRKRLESVVRRRSPQHWLVERAKIVLMSHRRLRIAEICAALSLDHQVVRRWLKRFLAGGFDALKDRSRAGRPPAIEARVWQKVTTLIVQAPERFGVPLARWSLRPLVGFLQDRFGWRVSRSSLSRFLRSMALKPHRVRYWLNPSDPDFDEKAAQICKLYLEPPPRTVVLSLDEKPGVQALRRTHPTRSMTFGKARRIEFEYERKGTRNVFAAFNIKTGHVLVWVTPERSIPYVFCFLDQILRFYKRGPIVIITDNISTRTGHDAQAWLARHPRVRFVFTPKHGSWLNQVEIWFGILTSHALRHRSFNGVRALANAIYRFAHYWNDRLAHPFAWTYSGRVLCA
jgi:transposase